MLITITLLIETVLVHPKFPSVKNNSFSHMVIHFYHLLYYVVFIIDIISGLKIISILSESYKEHIIARIYLSFDGHRP